MTRSEGNFLEAWLQSQEKLEELRKNLDEFNEQLREYDENRNDIKSDSSQGEEAAQNDDRQHSPPLDTINASANIQEYDTINPPANPDLLYQRDSCQLMQCRKTDTLDKRLSDNSDLLRKYDDTIREQLSQQVIERCEADKADESITHYLPYHPIIRLDE
uniref:Kinesin_assoc domain-containing protein n=1 Tax=Ascaris lumbricoides TaxID=6252 RepID=A0A0M3I414_ASCLU